MSAEPATDRRPVLITGGAGFIGSNLADRLAREGHRVLVYDALARPGVEANLAWLRQRHPDRVSVVIGDIRDADAVADAAGDAKAVFHLAAQVAVTTSLARRARTSRSTCAAPSTSSRRCAGAPSRRRSFSPRPTRSMAASPTCALDKINEAYRPRDPAIRANGYRREPAARFPHALGCSKGAADQYVLDYARSFGVPTACCA